MTNCCMNSSTKITEKKTLGSIDEVEKLVQSAVRKMYITDNIRFSRHLFLEQLNNQFSFFILVQTQSPKNSLICSSLLGKTWVRASGLSFLV